MDSTPNSTRHAAPPSLNKPLRGQGHLTREVSERPSRGVPSVRTGLALDSHNRGTFSTRSGTHRCPPLVQTCRSQSLPWRRKDWFRWYYDI
jgi:hypothetical protein